MGGAKAKARGEGVRLGRVNFGRRERYVIGLCVNFFSPLTYSATVWPLP